MATEKAGAAAGNTTRFLLPKSVAVRLKPCAAERAAAFPNHAALNRNKQHPNRTARGNDPITAAHPQVPAAAVLRNGAAAAVDREAVTRHRRVPVAAVAVVAVLQAAVAAADVEQRNQFKRILE